MRLFFIIFLILTFIGPISILIWGRIDFMADYRDANRDSIHIAPDPATVKEALIQIYAARAFNWRGIFATHTWIATKEKNAEHYTVYQIIGWRLLRNLSALSITEDLPDRRWFNQNPHLVYELRGEQAETLIQKIANAAKSYPYPDRYVTWPGPNSNTFPAYVLRQVPELHATLPSNALGKDFLPNGAVFTVAPSHTGYQFSLFGLFGMMLAKEEGIEINVLGLVYGFSPKMRIIKLPGFGDIKI